MAIQFSAALLVKSTARSLNYHIRQQSKIKPLDLLRNGETFHPLENPASPEQTLGANYARRVSTGLVEVGSSALVTQHHMAFCIWFYFDEVRIGGFDHCLFEHKRPILQDEPLYPRGERFKRRLSSAEFKVFSKRYRDLGLLQLALYGALLERAADSNQVELKPAKWAGHDESCVIHIDRAALFLNVGGDIKRVIFDANAVLDFYKRKMLAALAFETAGTFDERFKYNEMKELSGSITSL